MPNDQTYDRWIGQHVVDTAGEKVGKVSQIYVADETGQPEWLTVTTGMFKSRASFVPIQGVTLDGDTVVVPFEKRVVKDAPQIDEDGALSPAEEEELYRYYGRADTSAEHSSRSCRPGTRSAEPGSPSDDAMTRSEEEVRVGTERREAGRARLRKYIVTEQVTQTVPVSHEEIRLEREPITDANVDAATSGPDISEQEHEVTLYEERPVVEKEVVPIERVRLATETVTGEETVSEEVRKERIEAEEPTGA